MSTLLSDGFDGVTAPALPTGYTFGAGIATTASPVAGITPTSGPNVLVLSPTGTNVHIFSAYGTPDGFSGDISVRVNGNATGGGRQAFGVFARASSASISGTSGTYYWAVCDPVFNNELDLYKVVSGVQTLIGSSVSVIGSLPDWYQITLTLAGTALTVALQDLGNGDWLNSSGGWQAGAATAISQSDSSIAGSGYYGVSLQAVIAESYLDDLLVTTPSTSSSATLSTTEGRDTAAFTGVEYDGHAAKTEGHDTANFSGAYIAPGAIARTEGHDVAAFFAGETIGTIARTEGGDVGALTGMVQNAILTTTEGGDFLAGSGGFNAPGAIGPTEGGDVAAFHGFLCSGSVAATDGRDVPAIAGRFATGATSSVAEGHDTAAVVGRISGATVLAATESGDSASFAASVKTSGVVHPTEGRDTAGIHATTFVVSSLAIVEAGDRGAIVSVALGIPPSFRVLEAGDVARFHGGLGTLHYNVYMSPVAGDPIDYNAPVFTTAGLTWTSAPLPVPGRYGFGVRAANSAGEEQNLDASVFVTFSATGFDVSNIPPPPVGLRAFARAGAKIVIEWSAGSTTVGGKKPIGFHVYATAGAILSYAVPVATVPFGASIAGAYQAVYQGIDGDTYTIGVRVYNASGEDGNTVTVAVTAVATGPLPVGGLSAVLVP